MTKELLIQEYNPIQAAINELNEKYRGVIFPVGTKAGMEDAKDARRKLLKLRTSLEALRKEIKEPALRRTQAIDAEAKAITTAIKELEDPIDCQIKEEEARIEAEKEKKRKAEAERVERIKAKIAALGRLPMAMAGEPASAILSEAEALESFVCNEDTFAEFAVEAANVVSEAARQMRELYGRKLAQEQEAARLAAEREAMAAERARLDAERAELEAQRAAAQPVEVGKVLPFVIHDEPAPLGAPMLWHAPAPKLSDPVPDFAAQTSTPEPEEDFSFYVGHVEKAAQRLQDTCHGLAKSSGWWTDLETGADLTFTYAALANGVKPPRNIGELLMLVVSEVSEAMEGARKGLMDDKLPHRHMLEVELADAVIRIFDMAGGLGLDLPGAIAEKLVFNANRADHKAENRRAEGGKKF